MKVLVDAVGCEHGGVATYVANLLRGWVAEFPEDEVAVLRATTDPRPPVAGVTVHEVAVPRPNVALRPVVQTREVRRRSRGVDAVLAAHPVTSLLRLPVPQAVVVHDFRHELRPDQFPASRRLIRRLGYRRAYAVASGFVCISQRTLDDLHRLHPRCAAKPATVVHHGADHVDDWPRRAGEPYVLAFGHHTNKNVELVLRAWQQAGITTPRLNIVGLSEPARAQLATLVGSLGLDGRVVLSRYLADDDFHALMTGSAGVLFPSDFEGFGLPVVEAMRLGKPVVVGPDDAVREVADGYATTARELTVPALTAAIRTALDTRPAALDAAREHAARYTWARTARQTREFLLSLA